MSPLFTEQWRMVQCSYDFSVQEAAKSCFLNPAAQPQFMVGPTSKKLCFLLNQTTIYVATGEPHPQPHTKRPFKCVFKLRFVKELTHDLLNFLYMQSTSQTTELCKNLNNRFQCFRRITTSLSNIQIT